MAAGDASSKQQVVPPLVSSISELGDTVDLHRQDSTFSADTSYMVDARARLPPLHQIVIGVSAQDDSETALSAFAAGVDGFMCKPFTLKTFMDTYGSVKAGVVTPGGALASREKALSHEEIKAATADNQAL